MLTDEDLRRDTRPASDSRRGLLAKHIIRMAYLRGLGRYRRADDAVAAIAAEQARVMVAEALA
jgi:hypothetical protein